MEKKYLIVNTGSASKKYSFYFGPEKIYSAHFEMEKSNFVVTEIFKNGEKKKTTITKKDYINAIAFIISSLIAKEIISSKEEIDLSGIRVVASGEYFLTNRFVDKEYLRMIKDAKQKAPLHLGPVLEEIKRLKKFLGKDKPIVGVSDSAFHATIPPQSRLYAIPIKDSRRFGIYRFGYHGISVKSVVLRAEKILGALPEKTIICHLGGGASITAVKDGKSFDTSMGFTPLEGLVMATRVGNIDASTVLYLLEKLKKNRKELGHYFNNECGLLGISGKSSDIRELLINENAGDEDSTLALKIYTDRVKQYIGRMATALGGVDLLIFAGTVGERSSIMRERICDNLKFLGIEIDQELNSKNDSVEEKINKADSPAKILVVKTDEVAEMAKEIYSLAS